MISERTLKLLGFRIGTFKYFGAAYFDWDRKTGKFVDPPFFCLFVIVSSGFAGAFIIASLLAIRLYLYHFGTQGIPEEGGPLEVNPVEKLNAVGTIAIAWGEFFVLIALAGLNVVLVRHRRDLIYVYNQLIAYNIDVLDMLKKNQISLDETHKKGMRIGEEIMLYSTVFSFIFPMIMLAMITHPMEPIHCMFLDWLEIDFSFTITLAPYLFLLEACLQDGAQYIIVFADLAELAVRMKAQCLLDLTPERIVSRNGPQCKIQTSFYGTLEDQDIINRYRTIQLFNVLINNIMGTIYVSYHQVALLTTASIMLYFAVHFCDVITEIGVLAYLIVGGAVTTPLLIVYIQSELFAMLIDSSDGFKDAGEKMFARGTVFRKFAKSCRTLHVEQAYPYYHIDKNTILDFLAQTVDYSITILLW